MTMLTFRRLIRISDYFYSCSFQIFKKQKESACEKTRDFKRVCYGDRGPAFYQVSYVPLKDTVANLPEH